MAENAGEELLGRELEEPAVSDMIRALGREPADDGGHVLLGRRPACADPVEHVEAEFGMARIEDRDSAAALAANRLDHVGEVAGNQRLLDLVLDGARREGRGVSRAGLWGCDWHDQEPGQPRTGALSRATWGRRWRGPQSGSSDASSPSAGA